jgi:hypothetical protein
MNNYKGVFYKESKEKNYFEGGAHFKYKDLYEVLLLLGGTLPTSEKEYSINSINNKKINSSLNLNKRQSYSKTRNFNQYNILPNTQMTFSINKNNLINNFNNNAMMGHNGIAKSRNNVEGYIFNENFRCKNKTHTTIFNYNQKRAIRDSLIKTFFNKKRNNINNEEKINNININNYEFINSNSHKSLETKRKKNNSRRLAAMNNMNQIYYYNYKCSDLINNNTNRIFNLKSNNRSKINVKKQLNYFKDKINIYFPRKDNEKYSRNTLNINKNMIDYLKTLEFNKDMIFKENNNNNFLNHPENNTLNSLKNCSSGINMNNYINKTISRNKYINGNNLSLRTNININEKQLKDSKKISQKKIKNNINELFNFNQRINKNIGKKNAISRNINGLNNNYLSQYFKYKTSDVNDFNKIN